MSHLNHIPPEDLVAYVEGILQGSQKELVDAHLQICPSCRQRLEMHLEVGRVLRAGTPQIDDPARRAVLRSRLALQSNRHHWTVLLRALINRLFGRLMR
jgi:anti-sigma factor RsiW